jgi:hypothetical protein
MNHNLFKQIIEKKEKRKICANHPVSVWKEGYKRCYWGFKLRQNCELLEQSEGRENKISKSTTTHMQLTKKGGDKT